MILPTLCLGMLNLTGTTYVQQNNDKGLHWFGIVWLHLLQYQKGGVRLVLLIPPSFFWDFVEQLSNVIDHRQYYFDWRGLVDGHPKVFLYLTPRGGHFFNFFIFCVNVRKNTRNNVVINMWHIKVFSVLEYGALFTINNFFHNTPIIFVSLVSHIF